MFSIVWGQQICFSGHQKFELMILMAWSGHQEKKLVWSLAIMYVHSTNGHWNTIQAFSKRNLHCSICSMCGGVRLDEGSIPQKRHHFAGGLVFCRDNGVPHVLHKQTTEVAFDSLYLTFWRAKWVGIWTDDVFICSFIGLQDAKAWLPYFFNVSFCCFCG